MLGLLVYLVSGLTGGARGLQAAHQLHHDIAGLKVKLAALDSQRTYLQKRVDGLDPQHLDLDLLGEEARKVLFFAEPNEIVVQPEPPK